jgi:aldehyde dehydrogenase (NAD+)
MKKDKMANTTQFYIDGQWVDPLVKNTIDVIDPATEEPFTTLAVGSAADVNRAVAAAKRAFPSFSRTTRAERLTWLRALLEAYEARYEEIAAAVSREMGAPIGFSRPLSRRSRILFSSRIAATLGSSRKPPASQR